MSPQSAARRRDDYASSLHRLPLASLPVTHPVLRKSQMVKNAKFESVVELYQDKKAGSGQYYVDAVATMLGIGHADGLDLGILKNIALLPTFDIFSVRLLLRDMGITAETGQTLPREVGAAVEAQMRKFTIPLLRYVYDGANHEAADLPQLLVLFRDPDVKRAEAHLRRLAEKIKIPVLQVPRFLEDYSDTFLAISLYHHTFDNIKPSVDQFLESVEQLKAHFPRDQVVLLALARVRADFSHIMKSTARRLNASEQLVSLLWGETVNAPLETLQPRIREFQFLLGYLLCGIAVKMAAWQTAFPSARSGTPKQCVELITTDIVYALARLRTAADNGLPRTKTGGLGRETASLQSFLRSFSPH